MRSALAKLPGVILARPQVSKILGVEVPSSVEGIVGVTHDSRAVEPGFAFVAVPGFKRDGVEFVPEAMKRGGSLVVAEREVPGAPTAVVPDARDALAILACAVFGDPSGSMQVFGITGTNGKTTTSYALYGILSAACGVDSCGLTTSAEAILGGERRLSVHTTPEAPQVQSLLAEMLRKGVRHMVMEVSSHGIALRRVAGTRFSGALFTNLSRDHLDLHGSMEEYYLTKRELFLWAEGPKLANADDAWGRLLAGEVEGVKTFGTVEGADYLVEDTHARRDGTSFALRYRGEVLRVETPLLGGYNTLNVAGAAAFALEAGVSGKTVSLAAREMPQVPGRFERVGQGEEFEVIVDYAHTDVGLRAVLEVAREVADRDGGRVICVFGAAGERDRAKRPLMGEVASKFAESSIITTDDAYSEDPEKIAGEVAAGADRERFEVILDRREAIRRALNGAKPRDILVVAGKGHERVQHLPEGDIPFHDASVIRELLEGR